MCDIGVYAYLRALFFENSEELGGKGILGQAPSFSGHMNASQITIHSQAVTAIELLGL
jgi:hypothetical protein